MKYIRLTKEQLEELHQEFINFLATQSITKDEWDIIKSDKPEIAEQELDVFSDLVWEGVLNKVEYIEHFSENFIYLFLFTDDIMNLIAVQVEDETINLASPEGFEWLRNNLFSEKVGLFQSEKGYSEDRNNDKFELVKQGGNITKGELYRYFEKLIG